MTNGADKGLLANKKNESAIITKVAESVGYNFKTTTTIMVKKYRGGVACNHRIINWLYHVITRNHVTPEVCFNL